MNRKGFTSIEPLLSIAVVALIAFSGWMVWQNRQEKQPVQTKAVINSSSTTNKPSEPLISGWQIFDSSVGKYSIEYPTSLVLGGRLANCPGVLLLGSDSDRAGSCQTDGASEIAVYANQGNLVEKRKLTPDSYSNIESRDVTVDGVNGTLMTGIYSAQGQLIGPEQGTMETKFLFYTNDRTYELTYTKRPSYANDLSEVFNKMVTQSLRFK